MSEKIVTEIDEKKRAIIKTVGTFIVCSFANKMLDDAYGLLKELSPELDLNSFIGDRGIFTGDRGIDLLFGDDFKNSGIIPGNTNINLLKANGNIPKKSRYVSSAFEKAKDAHFYVTKSKKIKLFNSNDPVIAADLSKNLLILGGPVANELTREICKYNLKQTDNNDNVPIFDVNKSPLQYGYYVGNTRGMSYWGDEKRDILRPNEDNQLQKLPFYGLIKKGSTDIIEPPIINNGHGDRLLWDMLSIIRVPNPYHKEDGTITIIGGMHGYSLEAFFREMGNNLKRLEKEISGRKYFQALIPAKISSDCHTSIDWDGGKGQWITQIIELSSDTFDY